ncbi:hypothetical protein [Streptomyces murinus]|uniref:hypothetical protein n=1 Tax=Streptomyces murinus TaxID=33900 RepID=UPI0036E28EC2
MGLFDRFTGTRHPPAGVPPVSREELRGSLLGLNQPDVPYVIRYSAGERCDLVAEWRLVEPARRQFFVESHVSHAVRIRMRLVQEDHELRALEEQWKVSRVGSPTGFQLSKQYTRGPSRTVSRRWTVGRGESGRLEMTETFRFDSARLREPLRQAVLSAGRTWRGVVFGKL